MTETSVVCLARLFIFSSITIKNAHPVNYLPVVWYSQRKEKRIFFVFHSTSTTSQFF